MKKLLLCISFLMIQNCVTMDQSDIQKQREKAARKIQSCFKSYLLGKKMLEFVNGSNDHFNSSAQANSAQFPRSPRSDIGVNSAPNSKVISPLTPAAPLTSFVKQFPKSISNLSTDSNCK